MKRFIFFSLPLFYSSTITISGKNREIKLKFPKAQLWEAESR